ncbi:MAG: hypothetical protein E6Z15_22520, partial [Paenibacillus macerans]|nr:hypothetical protein [Paenibacillus macerans]
MKLGTKGAERTFWVREHRKARLNSRFDAVPLHELASSWKDNFLNNLVKEIVMAVQHETELYAPLKAFFEERGYIVRSEVRHCDLVGYRPGSDEPLIVEMKKTFNLPLLLQGLERQKLSGEVYLAVEKNRAKKGAHNQRWSEIT